MNIKFEFAENIPIKPTELYSLLNTIDFVYLQNKILTFMSQINSCFCDVSIVFHHPYREYECFVNIKLGERRTIRCIFDNRKKRFTDYPYVFDTLLDVYNHNLSVEIDCIKKQTKALQRYYRGMKGK